MPDFRPAVTSAVMAHRVVRRVDVVRAKQFVMQSRGRSVDTDDILNQWTKHEGLVLPVVLDAGDAQAVQGTGRYLAARMACLYAIHELIVSAALLPGDGHYQGEPHVQCRRDTTSGGLSFGEEVVVPRRAHKRLDDAGRLVDGDLFVAGTGLELDERIGRALRQASECYRRDLLIPALAMLDAASEGMWSMTGSALLAALPVHAGAPELTKHAGGKGAQFRLIRAVRAVAETPDALSTLGLSQQRDDVVNRLAYTSDWSDLVRKSRNELHWNAKQATPPNDADKVAQLMLSVGERFAVLDLLQRRATNPP